MAVILRTAAFNDVLSMSSLWAVVLNPTVLMGPTSS